MTTPTEYRGVNLPKPAKEWDRETAEKELGRVLDAAKAGARQIIVDGDDNYEITYRRKADGEPLGRFLARGEFPN